jgi:hypothetical protein
MSFSLSFLSLNINGAENVPNTSCDAVFILNYVSVFLSLLGGSLVTAAWRIRRLRMEETASIYGG